METKETLIAEAEQKVLELATEIACKLSLVGSKENIGVAAEICRFLRVLETNSNIDGVQLQIILSALKSLLNNI